jgi:hypothetical protein
MDVSQAPTRRERHRARTWSALHEAALSLTEEPGLAKLTIEASPSGAEPARLSTTRCR